MFLASAWLVLDVVTSDLFFSFVRFECFNLISNSAEEEMTFTVTLRNKSSQSMDETLNPQTNRLNLVESSDKYMKR